MDGACGMHERDEKRTQHSSRRTWTSDYVPFCHAGASQAREESRQLSDPVARP
jgi:hypothetical protein